MDAEQLLRAFTPEETLELAAALPSKVIEAEAVRRGIELPVVAGAVAVEGAMQDMAPEAANPSFETKESIAEKLSVAYEAYQAVVDSLNNGRSKNNIEVAGADTLAAELEVWLTGDKLALINTAQETDPELRFTLVATPNVLADSKDIAKTAKALGKDPPYEAYVYEPLYDQYTAEQLSGTNPDSGDKMIFSLIPSKLFRRLEGSVQEQRAELEALKSVANVKVPSVLEAITYWQTLRAQDGTNGGVGAFERTYIRHFDLPEKRIGRWSYVPHSCVTGSRGSVLNRSGARGRWGGRISVG